MHLCAADKKQNRQIVKQHLGIALAFGGKGWWNCYYCSMLNKTVGGTLTKL